MFECFAVQHRFILKILNFRLIANTKESNILKYLNVIGIKIIITKILYHKFVIKCLCLEKTGKK